MTIYLETAPRAAQSLPMTDAEREARVQLAACYRIFDMFGWVEQIFNHIIVRVPGPEVRFLINPFGLNYREITASNLLLIGGGVGIAPLVDTAERALKSGHHVVAMMGGVSLRKAAV